MKNKILGNLVGAAAGDAMGAPTELRTRGQIEEKFGGYVKDFETPPTDTFARGRNKGSVTDDFSLAYVTIEEIILNKGVIDEEISTKALLKWSETDYFESFAGPTTRAAIYKLKGMKLPGPELFVPINDNFKATNGLGMKMAPIALFSNQDVDKAIEMAITVGKATHPNDVAISAGCAVAAATSKAMTENATLIDVVNAGLYGAKKGQEIAQNEVQTFPSPSVYERMKLAIDIAYRADDLSEAINELSDIVGSGLHASEAIPTAFGIMVASKGNTVDAIQAAVNIGSDTDTIATIVGGILGTLNGVESMPTNYKELIEKENNYDFDAITEKVQGIINGL